MHPNKMCDDKFGLNVHVATSICERFPVKNLPRAKFAGRLFSEYSRETEHDFVYLHCRAVCKAAPAV